MNQVIRFLVAAIAGAAAASASGAQHNMDSGGHREPHAPALADKSDLPYRGEVRKVDIAKGRVTLKHGPIVALGMSAMTMEYLAADKKLLEGLHVGEKVRFKAERLHGAFVLTGIAETE